MRFVIYAYESTYGGLHGIYDICVTEANSLDEVDNIGETMAYEVIDTYSHLFANDEDKSTKPPLLNGNLPVFFQNGIIFLLRNLMRKPQN